MKSLVGGVAHSVRVGPPVSTPCRKDATSPFIKGDET